MADTTMTRAALLTFAAVALAACGGDDDGDTARPEPAATTQQPTTTTIDDIARGDYLASVDLTDATVNLADTVGDDRVVQLGRIACGAFDSGAAPDDVQHRMESEPELDPDPVANDPAAQADRFTAAAAVVVAAATHLCPEYYLDVERAWG